MCFTHRAISSVRREVADTSLSPLSTLNRPKWTGDSNDNLMSLTLGNIRSVLHCFVLKNSSVKKHCSEMRQVVSHDACACSQNIRSVLHCFEAENNQSSAIFALQNKKILAVKNDKSSVKIALIMHSFEHCENKNTYFLQWQRHLPGRPILTVHIAKHAMTRNKKRCWSTL